MFKSTVLPLTVSTMLISSPVYAAPGDGPVIDAGSVMIMGAIYGEITNGRQGGNGFAGLQAGPISVGAGGGANQTAGGRVNVNGIVQQGQSLIKANTIMLNTTLGRNVTNNAGDLTISGITQVGR
jgi:hypothetical protein